VVSSDGFYPSGHELDDAYTRRWGSTLVERMAAASRRLAAVLNECLAKR